MNFNSTLLLNFLPCSDWSSENIPSPTTFKRTGEIPFSLTLPGHGEQASSGRKVKAYEESQILNNLPKCLIPGIDVSTMHHLTP